MSKPSPNRIERDEGANEEYPENPRKHKRVDQGHQDAERNAPVEDVFDGALAFQPIEYGLNYTGPDVDVGATDEVGIGPAASGAGATSAAASVTDAAPSPANAAPKPTWSNVGDSRAYPHATLRNTDPWNSDPEPH